MSMGILCFVGMHGVAYQRPRYVQNNSEAKVKTKMRGTPRMQFKKINAYDKNGNTLLHKAVQSGKIDKVNKLLANKYLNPNKMSKSGTLPVVDAYNYEEWESLNHLLGDDRVKDCICDQADFLYKIMEQTFFDYSFEQGIILKSIFCKICKLDAHRRVMNIQDESLRISLHRFIDRYSF